MNSNKNLRSTQKRADNGDSFSDPIVCSLYENFYIGDYNLCFFDGQDVFCEFFVFYITPTITLSSFCNSNFIKLSQEILSFSYVVAFQILLLENRLLI